MGVARHLWQLAILALVVGAAVIAGRKQRTRSQDVPRFGSAPTSESGAPVGPNHGESGAGPSRVNWATKLLGRGLPILGAIALAVSVWIAWSSFGWDAVSSAVHGRRLLLASGGMALVLWTIWALWKIPHWQATSASGGGAGNTMELLRIENDARATLAQILGGLFFLAGLWFTWQQINDSRTSTERTLRLTQQQIEDARQSAAASLRLTEAGQVVERFTRATDQLGATDDLGNETLEIRLGGLFALEQIARSSGQHHWPVMEILLSYLRTNAPLRASAGNDLATPELSAQGEYIPRVDVQAALAILARRDRTRDVDQLIFREWDLQGAQLFGAHLENALFVGTNLEGAYLRAAHLEGATFSSVNLTRATLQNAHLRGASGDATNFTFANLQGADLRDLRLANPWDPAAMVTGFGLYRANLRGADLRGANLWYANLEEANLEGARLEGADFTHAAGLTQAQVDTACADATTQLPVGLHVPARAPTSCRRPLPEECRITPREPEVVLALAAMPAASPTPDLSEPANPTAFVAPEGEPADAATVAAVTAVLREQYACLNAGETLRFYALVTDAFLRRETFAAGPPDPNALGRPPEPLPLENQTVVFGIRDVRVLPDGRVGVFEDVGTVGTAAVPPTETTNFNVLVKVGDRWLLDEFVASVSGAGTPEAGTPAA